MTDTASSGRRQRRQPDPIDRPVVKDTVTKGSKLDRVEDMLLAPEGVTIAVLMAATGWQPHSVRGAIAGALRKRGLIIGSERVDGVRRYHACRPA